MDILKKTKKKPRSCTCPLWRALAIVGVDSIHTYSSIHALVTWTVIHIILTVVALKP